MKLQEQLGKIELVAVEENLVDAIWADRPKNDLRQVKSLPVEYSGRSVADKLQWLRREHLKTVKAILLSQLDEIACTPLFDYCPLIHQPTHFRAV